MTTFRTPALPYPSKAISSNHTSFDLFLDPTNHIPSQQTSKTHSPPDKNQERQKCPLKTLILKAAISPTWPLTAPLFPQIQQSKGLFPLFPDQARSQTIRTIRTTMELPIWQVLLTTRPTFQGWVLITLYIWPTHRPIFEPLLPCPANDSILQTTRDNAPSADVITGTGDSLPSEVGSKRLHNVVNQDVSKGHGRYDKHVRQKGSEFDKEATDGPGEDKVIDGVVGG